MIENYRVYSLNKKERLLFFSVAGCTIFAIAILFFDSVAFASLAVALIFFLQEPYAKYLAEKRLKALRKEFVDFVYTLSGGAAVNVSVTEALCEAQRSLLLVYGQSSNLAGEIGLILQKVKMTNESEKSLLYDLADRTGVDEIKSFFEIYYGCRESGGDLVEAVNRAGQTISDKIMVENDIKVFISQKKLESTLITVMPIAIIAFLRIFSPTYLDPLYQTNQGQMIMVGCLCIVCFSYIKVRKMTNVVFTENLESELPDVINRISLLLSSGKVFTEVMEELGREGENSNNSVLRLFSDAQKIAKLKNSSVINELRILARKSGSRELIRTVGILANNVDKGVELSQRLDGEAEMLWHLCKKQVEERGKIVETKMALPMGMMMLVLIIITTAPAFLTL